MSDKFVIIKRRPYTKEKVSKDSVLVAQDKHSIGGSITSTGATYKGITPSEERILMPYILSMAPSEPGFLKASTQWFDDLKRHVPISDIKLNVALENDELPFSADNLPKVPEDYILWRYCTGGYKCVAKTMEELSYNINANFYIYNEEANIKEKHEKNQDKIKAIKELSKVQDDEKVVNELLRVLMGKVKDDKSFFMPVYELEKVDLLSKQNTLADVATSYPTTFLSIVNDKDLGFRAEVYEMINKKIIEKAGTRFVFAGEQIGASIDHVIAFVKSAENSKTYATIKARLDSLNDTPRATVTAKVETKVEDKTKIEEKK